MHEYLINLYFPFLQNLNTIDVHAATLVNLIENTNRCLTAEASISSLNHTNDENKRIIRAIYQNCPTLKYLKLFLKNKNISELEKLLISCQDLNGLNGDFDDDFEWVNYLFKVLSKSSPTFFKSKFTFYKLFELKSLKLFLDSCSSSKKNKKIFSFFNYI